MTKKQQTDFSNSELISVNAEIVQENIIDNMTAFKIGDFLKEQYPGKKLKELAKELNFPLTTLRELTYNNKRVPSLKHADKYLYLARKHNITLEELLFGKKIEKMEEKQIATIPIYENAETKIIINVTQINKE